MVDADGRGRGVLNANTNTNGDGIVSGWSYPSHSPFIMGGSRKWCSSTSCLDITVLGCIEIYINSLLS
jgi:hypothetical protein